MKEMLKQTAKALQQVHYRKPAAASIVVKCRFHAVRMLQTSLGKKIRSTRIINIGKKTDESEKKDPGNNGKAHVGIVIRGD